MRNQNNKASKSRRTLGGFVFVLLIGLAASGIFGAGPAQAGCASGIASGQTLALSDIQCQGLANFTGATAVGNLSQAISNGSAFGDSAEAGVQSTAVGASAVVTGHNATAVGFASGTGVPPTEGATTIGAFTGLGAGIYATAIGAGTDSAHSAQATGEFSVAIGGNNGLAGTSATTASGIASTAVGSSASAAANGASAYGNLAQATGVQSTAIGASSTASGPGSFAGGLNATASGANSVAMGGATASGTSSVAMGTGAVASATNATAIGVNSSAAFANSTAIGNGAVATAPNQMALGTASNTYKMSGIASAASLAAQTGPVSLVTTDAFGNLATSSFNPTNISTLQGNVTTLQGNVAVLQSNVAVLQTQIRQAFEGTAIAIAMGGSALPDNKKFAISANYGNFRGQNAASIGGQLRLSENLVANVAFASGLQLGGVGSRAGLTFAW